MIRFWAINSTNSKHFFAQKLFSILRLTAPLSFHLKFTSCKIKHLNFVDEEYIIFVFMILLKMYCPLIVFWSLFFYYHISIAILHLWRCICKKVEFVTKMFKTFNLTLALQQYLELFKKPWICFKIYFVFSNWCHFPFYGCVRWPLYCYEMIKRSQGVGRKKATKVGGLKYFEISKTIWTF